MPISRRRFVHSATLSVLAGAALRPAWSQMGLDLSTATFGSENLVAFNGLSMQTFQALKGEAFTVSSGDQALGSMTLLSVTEYVLPTPSTVKNRPIVLVRQPLRPAQSLSGFSVQFQRSGAALPQGTYTLQNDSIGSLPLLLVPSSAGTSPTTYTAVFNFLVAPGTTASPIQKEAISAPTR
jgi:Domain of unknown function (DUF6916)